MANKNDLLRLIDNDGVYRCPITKSDGVFMSDGNTTLTKKMNDVTSQLEQKTDKAETQNIQQQVNNLVLGAVGDGNNAEIIQARGIDEVLNDRLNIIDDGTGISTLSPKTVNDYYINNSGAFISYVGAKYTDIIELNQGDKLIIKGYGLSNTSFIYKYNYYVPELPNTQILAGSNEEKTYIYTATDDKEKIRICYSSNHSFSVRKISRELLSGAKSSKLLNYDTSLSIETINSYIHSKTGIVTSGNGYRISDLFTLKYGETVKFTAMGENSNVALLYKFDSDGTPISVVYRGNGATTEYEYTATEDIEYFKISFKTISKFEKYIGGYSFANTIKKLLEGKLEKDDKVILADYSVPLNKLNPAEFKDGLLQINGINTGNTNYSATGWKEIKIGKKYRISIYDSNKNIVECSVGLRGVFFSTTMADFYSDTSNNKLITFPNGSYYDFISDKVGYLRLNFVKSKVSYIQLIEIEDESYNQIPSLYEYFEPHYLTSVDEYLINIKEDIKNIRNLDISKTTVITDTDVLKYLFSSGITIGDSITEGYRDSINDAFRAKSYPAYLAKMSGWNITNAGISGATCLSWWNSRKTVYDYSNYQFAIINLGQNAGLTDTLETDTTITETQTYLDYAETNTGTYCKIIEHIYAQNPNCKLFLVKGQKDTVTNSVIDKIALKYSLPLINVDDTKYYTLASPIYHGNFGVHYTTIGYLTLARFIFISLMNIINENLTEYQNY